MIASFTAVALFFVASAFESDIISDIISPAADERRSRDIKSEQFWEPILEAGRANMQSKHRSVYVEVDATIAALPEENSYVRSALREAADSLQRADEAVSQQAERTVDIATEQLASGPSESASSFLTGGQNFLALSMRRFVGGGYQNSVDKDVAQRQGKILPLLQGTEAKTGNVLKNCRVAVQRSFDVLKHDVYNTDAPKTPAKAKLAANKITKAAGETKREFLQSMNGASSSLERDTQEKRTDPTAIVTRTLMGSLERFGHGEVEAVKQHGSRILFDV
jgi:hypothetical protein